MQRMKLYLVCAILVGCLALGLSPTAQADTMPGMSPIDSPGSPPPDPFILRFDENGNASISVNGGPMMPLQGSLIKTRQLTGLR